MMVRAATDDVRFLLNIYEKMMEKLSKVSLWRLAVRSELYCRCFCLNDNQFADGLYILWRDGLDLWNELDLWIMSI